MKLMGMARGAWRYREFIAASVRRDFASRYLGTQLGFIWAIAQPVALIAIYTIVFAQIMRPVLPGHTSPYAYGIYLTAGITLWGLFTELLSRLVGMFVHNANLLKKVSLPKVTLPVIVVANSLLHFAIVMGLFALVLVAIGAWPGVVVLAVIPTVAVVIALATGLGLLLATINVFYRDVEHSLALILNFWFWLTPIVYPTRALPDAWQAILAWNPMAPLVAAIQTIFVDRLWPDWSLLVYPLVLALLLLALGARAFWRLSDDLVDDL